MDVAFKGARCVFHAAAQNTTGDSRDEVISNTVKLTKLVLDTVLANLVPTVIYTSSVVVLGRSSSREPITETTVVPNRSQFESPYVEGKYLADQLCNSYIQSGLDIRRTYPSWLLGDNDQKETPPHQFVRQHAQKGTPFWFDGGISVADVSEVAKAHIAAFTSGRPNSRYILAGENVTFQWLFTTLAQLVGNRPPSIHLPRGFILFFASLLSPLRALIPRLPSFDYLDALVGRFSWYSSDKAIRELGYKPTPPGELVANAIKDSKRRALGIYNLGRSYCPKVDRTDRGVLLITGAPGWLGNRMIDILINGDRLGRFASTRKVRLLVEPRFRELLKLPGNFEITYGTLENPADLATALRDVVSVFHLAGAIYPPRISTLYQVNAQGTANLVQACIQAGVRRFIYMGTDAICGHGTPTQHIFTADAPATPYRHYGRSKAQGEASVLQATAAGQLDGTSLRGFWFFGPFAPARQQGFARQFHWPFQPIFGNGRNLRSISHIDDVIAAFFLAEKEPKTVGKWYWIAGQEPHTVHAIYAAIATASHTKLRPFYIPLWVCRCINKADLLYSRLGRLHPTLHAAGKFYFDIAGRPEVAKADFGFVPQISLQAAAEEMVRNSNGRHPQ